MNFPLQTYDDRLNGACFTKPTSHCSSALKQIFGWLFLLLTLAQVSLAKAPSQTSTVASPDLQSLIDLYNSTNGPGWTNKTNWLSGDSPCNWYGIVCNPENDRVIALDLSANNLSGTLPTSLPQLSKLWVLNLGNNKLMGTIPANLGQLVNLRLLYLNDNQFTGTLPTSLSGLPELLLLDVDFNKLTGSIPSELSALGKIKQLALSHNQFTGSIPASLGQLANLQVLYLDNNKLTGSIPNELSSLSKLQLLSVAKNQLTGSIPASLSQLSQLLLIYLNNNKLTGSIPASLSNLTKLQYIYFNNNQLSGCLPPALSVFCGRVVDLSGNPSLPGGGDFAAFCSSGQGSCGGSARLAATSEKGIQVVVLGNPVLGSEVLVEVTGAEGQPLTFQLRDLSGKLINERIVGKASRIEKQGLEVSHVPMGLLLLQVMSPLQSKTIKVLKN
ncbi:hypothetical protein [Spirosoma sp. KNUC1025]|uniref:hypothetical protein n=1 Tax=Spirosoma sp. KNUC1025 TaxID=2894082 RepID=UPI003866730E|nr:hypothetical protein LN737_00705 [Spirosoma sp. KNUC1025]